MNSSFAVRGREKLDDVLISPDVPVLRVLMCSEIADQARYQSNSLMSFFKREDRVSLLMDILSGNLVQQLKTAPGDSSARASLVPYASIAAEISDLDAENARDLRRVAYNALQVATCGNVMLNISLCKPENLSKFFSIPDGPVRKSRYFCWIMSKAFHSMISMNPRELIGYLVSNPERVRSILARSDSTELYQILIKIATSLEDGTGAQVLYDEKVEEMLFNKFVEATNVKEASIVSRTICDFIGNSRSSSLVSILFEDYFQVEKVETIYKRILAVKNEHLTYAFAIVVETINYFKGNTKVESMTEDQFINILAGHIPFFNKILVKGNDEKCGQVRPAVIPILEYLLQSKSETVFNNAKAENIFNTIWSSCIHYTRNNILHAAVSDMIRSTYGKSNYLADDIYNSADLLGRLSNYRTIRDKNPARSEFVIFLSKIGEHVYNSFKTSEKKPLGWDEFISTHENMISYWDGGSKTEFPEKNQVITYAPAPSKQLTPSAPSSPSSSTITLSKTSSIPSLKLSTAATPEPAAETAESEKTEPKKAEPEKTEPVPTESPPSPSTKPAGAPESTRTEEQPSEPSKPQVQQEQAQQPATSRSLPSQSSSPSAGESSRVGETSDASDSKQQEKSKSANKSQRGKKEKQPSDGSKRENQKPSSKSCTVM